MCVAATRWGVQRQVCLAYSQAWWWECHGLGLHEYCQHWAATVHWGNMSANMFCDILKQSMIPSLRRLGHRAVFQHDNNPKHTSKMTTSLLKKLRVKVICGASSNGRWRSTRSLTSTSSMMSSWRSGRGLCQSVISSVLSHEKICKGCAHFCEILYLLYIYYACQTIDRH